MLPKLSDELSADYITIDPHDLAAEGQICINTQLSYGGHSPYECLFGCQPTPLFDDEAEHINQLGSSSLAFYEHQHESESNSSIPASVDSARFI